MPCALAAMMTRLRYRFGSPVLGEIDEYLIGEGTHRRLWTALGAHVMTA
jgi:1,4-alpha-glucan branching enzyme